MNTNLVSLLLLELPALSLQVYSCGTLGGRIIQRQPTEKFVNLHGFKVFLYSLMIHSFSGEEE